MVKPAYIAIVTGILPVIAVFVAYGVAVSQGHLPACIPMLEGCTSISATGRQSPESLLFRATMIPSAMLMMLFWYLMMRWLVVVNGRARKQYLVVFVLGLVAAIFLIIYTVALGFIDPGYSLQRRIGVTLFFSCALVSQLMATNEIVKLVKSGSLELPYGLHYWLVCLCGILLLLGLSNIPLSVYFSHISALEDIVEWNFAVVMTVFYIIVGLIWQSTGFYIQFRLR